MPTEGICTRMKFTMSFVALPMAMNQMGRAARPLACKMALHSSIMHTKAEAMPRTIRQWLAISWLVSGYSIWMMGPDSTARPTPAGRASRAPTRRADSAILPAPILSFFVRAAETAGTMQAVRETMKAEGRL